MNPIKQMERELEHARTARDQFEDAHYWVKGYGTFPYKRLVPYRMVELGIEVVD